jgi:hypothetical protein
MADAARRTSMDVLVSFGEVIYAAGNLDAGDAVTERPPRQHTPWRRNSALFNHSHAHVQLDMHWTFHLSPQFRFRDASQA